MGKIETVFTMKVCIQCDLLNSHQVAGEKKTRLGRPVGLRWAGWLVLKGKMLEKAEWSFFDKVIQDREGKRERSKDSGSQMEEKQD